MSDTPTPEALQFWKERAQGYERRINAFINGLNEAAGEVVGTTLEDCLDGLNAGVQKQVQEQAQQLNTLRCYLWAVVTQAGGSVTVPDAVLERAFSPTAHLNFKARPDGSQATIEAHVDFPKPAAESAIVQPERRIVLPPGHEERN
jgi:hypothetical protein